jgi:hypothetical protein
VGVEAGELVVGVTAAVLTGADTVGFGVGLLAGGVVNGAGLTEPAERVAVLGVVVAGTRLACCFWFANKIPKPVATNTATIPSAKSFLFIIIYPFRTVA